MAAVEKEGKECEEETLQTAFKKLRVDAESSTTTVRVCETLASRLVSRGSPEGAKSKITSSKDNWHGCTRKSSRGVVRSQRRRRSKSPILHPPKFTYCSKMPPPPGHLKHKSPPESDDTSASLGISVKKEVPFSAPCTTVFGVVGYENHLPSPKGPDSPQLRPRMPCDDESVPENRPTRWSGQSSQDAAECNPSDFQTLSKLQEGSQCPCGQRECQCPGWQGVEVYSFTGLRDVISECEQKLPSPQDSSPNSRTNIGKNNATSSSPRSCSEQARAYVDDITIEDLSGYMEYYLYIPKKMSHMAEMMYT
ncbi:oxidative stress-responsive serine-rich protein 1-like [Myxocyprinus asiaticus]|uniref:oxidative stress-responsive serine-rich protein 1-like n=1 Tax=Myxocyprinus asiaticus TaxID=70543 RepID=UPI00222222F3|nr:oxidative stress-responsive serine-rich protein 1-like [Myxocyprinus asiaticus]XP_051568921.1 oxidative stress-responsive serine-rich protein 1-like [Myxocyprinus asiaticus]